MANTSLQPIFPVEGALGGMSGPTLTGLEAATQTFKRGAPVVNSAGFLAEAAANPAAIIGIARSDGHNLTVAGVANAASTGIIDPTSPNQEFTPIQPSMIFEISVDKAAARGGALAVLAQSDMWGDFGITKDSLGFWYLDVDKAAANQVVVVVAFKDPAGTVNGRVLVTFKQTVNA